MKKLLLTTILALLTAVCAMGQRYDFKAVSGINTLFYKITDAENKEVAVVSELNPWKNERKAYNTKPKGKLIIPSAVTNDSITYSVTSIGDNAFYWCYDLTDSITIPNSIKVIGNEAFTNCFGLTGTLTIPNSVTTIGSGAFNACSGLTGDLIIPNSVTDIELAAFMGCSGFRGDLIISNSVTDIEFATFKGCSGFTGDLVIPNSVTSIGEEAFNGCRGLGTLTIGDSVTIIGTAAFAECRSLIKVTSHAKVPQNLISHSLSGVGIDTIPLYVPEASIEAYSTALIWQDFKSIEALEPILLDAKTDKKDAIDALNTYLESDYRATEWTALLAIFDKARDSVEVLTTTVEVEKFDISGLTALAEAIKTNSELTAIEAELAQAKTDKKDAIDALNTYLESDYRATEWAALVAIFDEARDSVDVLTTTVEIEKLDISGLTALAEAIKTDAQLTEEEKTTLEDVEKVKPFVQYGNVLQFTEPTQVVIYSVSGAMLHKGEVVEYQFQAKGVYVVQTENGNYKIIN